MNDSIREWESRHASEASRICTPRTQSGGIIELVARLVVGGCVAALLFIFWAGRWDAATLWAAKELCVLPRMSLFLLAGLLALLVQGSKASTGVVGIAGLISLLLGFCLLPTAGTLGAGGIMIGAGAVLQLMRFELSMMAAVCCGTWLGRDIKNHMQFLAIVLCAAAGDVWLSTFHVPESVVEDHPLSLLRLPFLGPGGRLGLCPSFTDLLFLSAIVEAGRNLGFHMVSVSMGAFAGYCAGSFLALDPWPAWPALSMLMCGSGVLVGCWPELKCSARDAGKAFLIGALLLATLIGLSALHRKFHPMAEPPIDPSYYRGFTINDRAQRTSCVHSFA